LTADDIARLYAAHARPMLMSLTRRTLDAEVALDLVAETFAVAVEQRAGFRGTSGEEQAGWLYGIARNLLADWYRRGAVERRALQRLDVERSHATPAEIERIVELAGTEVLRGRVAEHLNALPDDAQAAVRLRVIDGLGYPEVAARLGLREDAARARVSRALRALGASLAGTGEVPSRG
jgi:RNA polymerase sigma-70 factor (ECF subfamily)